MPSLLSTTALLTAFSLLTSITAAPFVRIPTDEKLKVDNLLAAFTVPLSNGTDTLPGPASLTLKSLTVGRGTQNYTCADSTATSTPKAVGAVATLFDARMLIPFLPPTNLEAIIDQIPDLLFSLPTAALDGSILPKAGHHYFNAQGAPVFDLTSSGVGLFVGNKTADINAPKDSTQGPNGAVPWLALAAIEGSSGIETTYRTFTVSGKPPKTCEGQKEAFGVEYAAQYYFFG